MALIWDGTEFKIMPEQKAHKLVAEDKAQLAEGLQGTQLKFREEFTGYSNKMMNTGTPKVSEETKVEKPKRVNISNKEGVKKRQLTPGGKPAGIKKISGA